MSKILVVDDSMFQRRALAKFLNEDGHLVLEADNGLTGLEKIETEKPELVILDLIMPKLGGFEALEELRRQGNNTPVIVFTADIQATSRQRCIELGAKAFLNKPLVKEELRGIVQQCLQQGEIHGGNALSG